MVEHRLLRAMEGVAILLAPVLQRPACQSDCAKWLSETVRCLGSTESSSRKAQSHAHEFRQRDAEEFSSGCEYRAADESFVFRSASGRTAWWDGRQKRGCVRRTAGKRKSGFESRLLF